VSAAAHVETGAAQGEAVPPAPLVSVIIPTRNGAARIGGVLGALERQTLDRRSFEVIVVDDGSTDGTAALAADHAGVRVVRTPGAGQPVASNLGVRAARAPLLAFTDDDTDPAPDWLERGLQAFERAGADLVAGRVELTTADPPTTAELLDVGRGYLDQARNAAEGFGATANLWTRRETLLALGGFNERAAFQTHDRDLGDRARAAGLRVGYAQEAVVRHPARAEARQLARTCFRLAQGTAWLGRHGADPVVRERRPLWRRRRGWVPWRSIWGLDRIQARGGAGSARERARLRAAQFACVQVPLTLGGLVGSLRERRTPWIPRNGA